MRVGTFTQNKDVDIEILNRLSDKDLISFCSTDRYAGALCKDQGFWQRRVFSSFGKYLDSKVIKKYKGNKSWSEYYIEIIKILETPHLEYELAKAMERDRQDLIILLKKLTKVKNIKFYHKKNKYENFITEFYLDDLGRIQGRKYDSNSRIETVGQFLNNIEISRIGVYPTGERIVDERLANSKKMSRKEYDEAGNLINSYIIDI